MYISETEITYIPVGSLLYKQDGLFKRVPFIYLRGNEHINYGSYLLTLQDANNPNNVYKESYTDKSWFEYLAPYDTSQIQELHLLPSKKPRGLRKKVAEFAHLREQDVLAITIHTNKRYYKVLKRWEPIDRSGRVYLTLEDIETGKVGEIFIHKSLRCEAFTFKKQPEN